MLGLVRTLPYDPAYKVTSGVVCKVYCNKSCVPKADLSSSRCIKLVFVSKLDHHTHTLCENRPI